jgi:2-polyprenyl-3-methyl-5-hydroxy-6-metoxy-1,4-benzoquinol methylase
MSKIKSCLICSSKKNKHYADSGIHEYIQCAQCGLVYLKRMPSKEDIYKAYNGGFFKSFRRKITAPFRKLENLSGYEERVSDFKKRLNALSLYSPEFYKLHLLDIGCNKCFLLEAAVKLGFGNVSGVELVPELTIQFQKKYPQYKKQIYHSDFSKLDKQIGDKAFDVITAFDLVEHLTTPDLDFKNIHSLLKENGVFLFQTPNTDSREAQELKERWGALKAYEHYNLFSEKNIIQFGIRAGFSKIDIIDNKLLNNGDMMVLMTK